MIYYEQSQKLVWSVSDRIPKIRRSKIMETFIVETSARHIHLSQEHIDILFGEGYTLTNKKDLSQPGQFACAERLDVVGPKKTIAGVSILGPARKASQVEVSYTDARTLGVTAPVRESGDTAGSPGVTLVNPQNGASVVLTEGVIVAKRHIHMTPTDAETFGVSDKEIVSVKVDTNGRTTVFGDTVVRVSPTFALAMHIDTDEANAAAAFAGTVGYIVK